MAKKISTKNVPKRGSKKILSQTSKRSANRTSGRKRPSKAGTRMSALDAAEKVLSESKQPLRSKEMIERMGMQGYWTSPGGKTPHATLYAAIQREIETKGKQTRFKKLDRGLFALNENELP